jgi:hypothetical protein
MRAHGVSFRHAVEILRSNEMPATPKRPVKTTSVPKLPPPVDPSANDQALKNQVVEYYHQTLKASPEAIE